MATIKLQFVLGSGWGSRLIAWWGQGYGGWSHVDAVLPNGELLGARSDAIGGKPPGVQIRPANYEKWKRRCVVSIKVTDAQAKAWEKWLREQIDKPYDKLAIVGFIIGLPTHMAGAWICSADQLGALKKIKLVKKAPLEDSQISPNSLFVLVTMGLGGKVVVDE